MPRAKTKIKTPTVPRSKVSQTPSEKREQLEKEQQKKQVDVKQNTNLAQQLKANQIIRENARGLIDPGKLINEILEIKVQMEVITEPNGQRIAPDSGMLAALKEQANINFKLLDKALPALRSVEVTGQVDHAHAHEHRITDIELASRLQMWRKQQNQIANDPKVIDITPTMVEEVPQEDNESAAAQAQTQEYDFL